MIEGTDRPFAKLNEMRKLFGLHVIRLHWHNLLLDERKLSAFLGRNFSKAVIQSMGAYYFISRIVHPLLVSPREPLFRARINDIARMVALRIDDCKDISVNSLYVLTK